MYDDVIIIIITGLLNNTINNKQGTQTVAFTAFLKNSLSNIPANQVIIFEDILTNVGGAYDKNDGHFQVCPISVRTTY